MAKNLKVQVYRAGVGAIIFNDKYEFLFVQNQSYREDEWDFVKGGMHTGESELETLNREILEELGNNFKYEVLRKSGWNVIYEWPLEKQVKEGMRGQARVSYWIRFIDGSLKIDEEELRKFVWVPVEQVREFLKKSGWTPEMYEPLLSDWNLIKDEISKAK